MAETDDMPPAPEKAVTSADVARSGKLHPNERGPTDGNRADQNRPSLLSDNEVTDLRLQWDTVQTGFVDEPRRTVENADALVASAMQRLAETFAEERAQLEAQWGSGNNVSTEELRIALQRDQGLFVRLLSI